MRQSETVTVDSCCTECRVVHVAFRVGDLSVSVLVAVVDESLNVAPVSDEEMSDLVRIVSAVVVPNLVRELHDSIHYVVFRFWVRCSHLISVGAIID